MNEKKTRTQNTPETKPAQDPKRSVQVIDNDLLEDVVGGFDDGGENGSNRRMSAEF
jgi:hypothetical protein